MVKINNISELGPDKIKKIYDDFRLTDYARYCRLELYAMGQNPAILSKVVLGVKDADLSKIPVSYARKIITTIAGYMFKPDSITYSFDEAVDQEYITDLYSENDEGMHNAEMGRRVSIYGTSYEMLYLDKDANLRLYAPDVWEVIPIYNYDLEPTLIAFIRWYMSGKYVKLDIYTDTLIDHYSIDTEDKNPKSLLSGSDPNLLDFIPLNIFKNNNEMMGDFENVLKLIDAYDNLLSSCNDELIKWAISYLLLAGCKLEDTQIEQMKATRTISGLDSKDSISWLTKDINTEFLKFMRDALREEIQLLTHVPDFVKLRSGESQSGASLDRLLFDFEFLCATKESFFKKALYNRFSLIDLNYDIGDNFKSNIKITFNRNKPSDSLVNSQLFNAYWTKLSNKTVIENFAPFVEDPEQEMIDKAEEDAGMMDALTPPANIQDQNVAGDTSGQGAEPGVVGPLKKVEVVSHTRTMPGVIGG
jgi:SPP1 family phage portal protein